MAHMGTARVLAILSCMQGQAAVVKGKWLAPHLFGLVKPEMRWILNILPDPKYLILWNLVTLGKERHTGF